MKLYTLYFKQIQWMSLFILTHSDWQLLKFFCIRHCRDFICFQVCAMEYQQRLNRIQGMAVLRKVIIFCLYWYTEHHHKLHVICNFLLQEKNVCIQKNKNINNVMIIGYILSQNYNKNEIKKEDAWGAWENNSYANMTQMEVMFWKESLQDLISIIHWSHTQRGSLYRTFVTIFLHPSVTYISNFLGIWSLITWLRCQNSSLLIYCTH